MIGQRRVGHAGTLDPDATGVLLVGVGRVTRLLRFLQDAGKAYRGTIAFGVSTTTLDAAGEVVDRTPMPLDRADVETAARGFIGEIDQLPPMVSAVKVGGRRLHELARRGEHVERAPRRVHIDRFEVESFEPGPYPTAAVVVECSRARTLDDIEADPEAALLAPAEAVRDLERVDVDAEQARAVTHGVTFPAAALARTDAGPGPFAVIDPAGELIAVYERRRAALKPAVVIAPVEAT